uniref:Uncharacterized protein n=1 Tax=Arundo donax TaxID=35708 RepID=A0A0A9C8K6_ARUDO
MQTPATNRKRKGYQATDYSLMLK